MNLRTPFGDLIYSQAPLPVSATDPWGLKRIGSGLIRQGLRAHHGPQGRALKLELGALGVHDVKIKTRERRRS